jgi:hypothetical protein
VTTPTHPDRDDAPRCTHCRRGLFDTELHRWTCRPCQDRAAKQLAELPGMYDELGEVLMPGATVTDGGGKVSTSRSAPLPVALAPLNLIAVGGIAASLAAIEDNWRAALGWPIPARADKVRVFAPWRGTPSRAVPKHTRFLANNLPWAVEQYEEIAYDMDVIAILYWQARNTLTGTRPRLIHVVCRAVYDDGHECGQRLAVDINRTSVLCQGCGTRWGREEWVSLYEATRHEAA